MYDILLHDTLVMTVEAIRQIEAQYGIPELELETAWLDAEELGDE